ncbi:hypothetical protein CXF83_18580 [Shewanella sp. Choline-02u-19]|uniref:hypothetical protein n=1 Tax=unclassified Shewanella TaxID=196818 RepID=UPI000C328420|nr:MULTISPECIES: hypothetical protein [unclassified Shewanella]PKG58694.1 hypothetical protein CXF82_03240 [Shewanella sp. GutDb-MelDb]PKG76728.1 hypothetical protein CXF86_01240 [Shewanella sp. GutCb]PKH54513.1 hypothetical protein CXF84_19785 [Shewanella sp. Bg11-22]PKI28570.1 hypothetical protein CXF83_18580 [Shewanella sp. Choline-02u-19]
MNDEQSVIDSLAKLEQFLLSVENGGLGLAGIEGVGMATNNADGRHFVAVFDNKHKLLHARWITDEIFATGKDMVGNGVKGKH